MKRYLLEIEANISEKELITVLNDSFKDAHAVLFMTDFVKKENCFYIELDLLKSDKNVLTAIFLFCNKMKSFEVIKFDYCRMTCEKENLMKVFL